MQIYHSQVLIDRLPRSNLKTHIEKHFDQLSEDTDVPPNLILVKPNDDITGPDYAFVGPPGITIGPIRRDQPRRGRLRAALRMDLISFDAWPLPGPFADSLGRWIPDHHSTTCRNYPREIPLDH
jgi:hypothetical protein